MRIIHIKSEMDRAILDKFDMIKFRVITVINESGMKLPQLEELTGISRYTWSNLKNPAKNREIKEEEITAIGNAFPEYRWWIFTGEEMPEVGQISPMTKNAKKS